MNISAPRTQAFTALLALCSATLPCGARSFAATPDVVKTSCAAADASACDFVAKLGSEFLTLAAGGDKAALESKAKELLRAHIDYQWVAKFAAGAALNGASDEQKKRYLTLYPDFLVKTYLPKFSRFAGSTFVISGAEKTPDGRSVKVSVKTPDKPEIAAEFKIRETSEGLKIYDIVAEGVSMIVTQRSEFSSAIGRLGMEDFLSKMAAAAGKA